MWTIFVPVAIAKASQARCCVLPIPEEPQENSPGFALICATSSRTLPAVTVGATASTLGTTTMSAIGAMSRIGSKPSFIMCGAIAWAELVATRSVWPSGAARAVTSAAIVFPAPGRFSTTNTWPKAAWNLSASMRAMMSVPPPGEAPTMIFTGLDGHAVGDAC